MEALKQSRVAVLSLTSGVGVAMEQTKESLEKIAGLETVIRRIEKVVDKIALVAVQTTMLAVSGAVEAARAGEAGRGFALVSSDIRGLAHEATESADQVKDTVRNILEQIGSVRRNLQHITETSEAEGEKNRLVFVALDRIGGKRGAADRRGGRGGECGLAPGRHRGVRTGARGGRPGRGDRGNCLAGR
jgi:methyl-accepting chemotaxis protein